LCHRFDPTDSSIVDWGHAKSLGKRERGPRPPQKLLDVEDVVAPYGGTLTVSKLLSDSNISTVD
jgi:hypothetical protein